MKTLTIIKQNEWTTVPIDNIYVVKFHDNNEMPMHMISVHAIMPHKNDDVICVTIKNSDIESLAGVLDSDGNQWQAHSLSELHSMILKVIDGNG